MTERVALHLNGLLALRVPRVLLAEPDIEIGLLQGEPGADRMNAITSVSGADALAVGEVSDAALSHIEEARAARIPVIVGTNLPFGYPVGDSTFVVGATLGSGLAAALAISMIEPGRNPVEARLAWTLPGRPLGSGIPVTFPEPVGPLWAGRDESPLGWPSVTCLAAPQNSPWLGIAVTLKTDGPSGTEELIQGIADDAVFLRAISMAASLVAAARGAYPPGINSPGDPGGMFMRLARAAGLEIAAFIPD